jgi:hypothetical protein
MNMKMKYARFFALILLAFAVFTAAISTLRAATISLNPVADAFVSSANPTNNYGGAGALEVSAAALAKGEFQSLLQFDLSSAKASFDATFGAGHWSTQSATLQLTAGAPSNGIFNSSAAGAFAVGWLQNDTWVEGTGTPNAPGGTGITFNSLPSFLSASDQLLGTFSFNGSTTATATYSLTVASGLSADAATGSLTSLLLTASDATMSGQFDSRSNNAVAGRPVLTIIAVAVPEPACWVLGTVGIAGFALPLAFRRHR